MGLKFRDGMAGQITIPKASVVLYQQHGLLHTHLTEETVFGQQGRLGRAWHFPDDIGRKLWRNMKTRSLIYHKRTWGSYCKCHHTHGLFSWINEFITSWAILGSRNKGSAVHLASARPKLHKRVLCQRTGQAGSFCLHTCNMYHKREGKQLGDVFKALNITKNPTQNHLHIMDILELH